MPRYRFTVEFDLDTTDADPGDYQENPGKWEWPELMNIDDEYTKTDWSTWNVEEVK